MRMFDVQGIEIRAPLAKVFDFVREPRNLPRWTQAFETADDQRGRLQTPAGAVDVALKTVADARSGTVDWRMEFAEGSVGLAQSRITETTRGTCIYSFVLHAPPVPLEQVEGALAAQRVTLRKELDTLKQILES
jgi:hypothetical protein